MDAKSDIAHANVLLETQIVSVRFSGTGGWSVLEVCEPGKPSDTFAAVGSCPNPETLTGAYLLLEGSWQTHPRWGRQFRFEKLTVKVPDDLAGMQRYLASDHFKNIGPARAAAIIGKFGVEAFRVIRDQTHLLTLIPGITPERAQQIRADYLTREHQQKTFEWLAARNVPFNTAVKIVAQLGGDTIRQLTENPYLLMEWDGFGFLRADDIARKIGIPRHAPSRARAAVLHLFREQIERNGHTRLTQKQVFYLLSTEYSIPREAAEAAIAELVGTDALRTETWADVEILGLSMYWEAENAISQWILGRIGRVAA